MVQRNSPSLTKGVLKALSHINGACKVHLMPLKIKIIMNLINLGTLPLIHHCPYLLLGLILLNILINLSTLLYSRILLNLHSGATPHKGGGLKQPNLLL